MNRCSELIDKLKKFSDSIYVCDDNSETNGLDYHTFSLDPHDIVVTDGFINYCNTKGRDDNSDEVISMQSSFYHASYICIFDESSDKPIIYVSKQKFTESKLIDLYNKILIYVKNKGEVSNFLIVKDSLPDTIMIDDLY